MYISCGLFYVVKMNVTSHLNNKDESNHPGQWASLVSFFVVVPGRLLARQWTDLIKLSFNACHWNECILFNLHLCIHSYF